MATAPEIGGGGGGAELGHQTVELSAVVRRVAEESYLALKELVDRSRAAGEDQSDEQKKIELLKFIVKTRQRMLRLHVLAKWCQQVPLVQYCQQLASTLSSHETCFTQTADSLFYMHEGLQHACAPMFDVPSAVEVLLTGSYKRLPKCIEDLGVQSALSMDEQKPVLKKLDTLLRSKLLEVSFPKEISNITISDGTAVLRVDGEFKVILTLGYRGHLSLWRILHLELLVGDKSGPVKLEESRRYALGDDLERRMAAAENPMMILYAVLHEFCVALVMDTVIRQVQVLRQGRWKDTIRFEVILDGSNGQGGTAGVSQSQDGELDSATLKTPGLKLFYWLESDKVIGGSDSNSPPFIKIEPAQDLQIKCSHSSFLLDPFTEKEAEFSLSQSCIDVEKLLHSAISCNIHTRLLEIQRELSKNVQLSQTFDDIILKPHVVERVANSQRDGKQPVDDSCGDEVLQVRAYGSLYITLGINIRNGRFLLQSANGVHALAALSDCEEALNQGIMTAAEVFISLRNKSLLHLFASIGRFLGLQVYDQFSSTIRIPKSVLLGSDLLLMGFPRCGDSYYLLLELEKDFRPLFKLLEIQSDASGNTHSISESSRVVRFLKIDTSQVEMVEDEKNESLINWDKANFVKNIVDSNQFSQQALLSKFGLEPAPQLSGSSHPNFSSVVDEVFASEKGSSGSLFPAQNTLSSPASVTFIPRYNSQLAIGQGVKSSIGSPKWETGIQQTKVNNFARISSAAGSNSIYPSVSVKGLLQSSPSNSMTTSSPVRNSSFQKLHTSNSDQDLSSLKSPHLGDSGKGTATGHAVGLSSSMPASSTNTIPCQAPESGSFFSAKSVVFKHDKTSKKRSLSEVVMLVPSFERSDCGITSRKRRKLEASEFHIVGSQTQLSKAVKANDSYRNHATNSNLRLASSNIYISTLLHAVRHCSLCIKHARLTSQMEALDIPYVEEVGLRTPSSNLWFRLPLLLDDSWQNICLRLGRPGSMSWDVKIIDEHFRELWQLQKGSTDTCWGSGVRIANASDADAHICFDLEGVILSYKSVESNSIQNLVLDLRRLSNARLFACGMRKLLGVRADDRVDANNTKILAGKASNEGVSEQVRRTFKIEAVGPLSLWFTYGTMPVTVHFVVEWESGKEGCTIHVSPDQLWPHTKFLEDFINGGEVASFLDCIRLTAGPLLALSHAIRPARMPAPVAACPTPSLKQNDQGSSQGLITNASSGNSNLPPSSGPMGAVVPASLGSHSLHNAAVLSAAARGGPGIVPSSLLPIDVSVVLRGPYWIRIIYRKKFAVDMRCFAGDQVWLQPAPPPKGGPAAGGSLPCPQFRPFIMEHVAQGLNTLEPTFAGNAHNMAHPNSSIPNHSTAVQPLSQNSSRLNPTNSNAYNRANSLAGSHVAGNLSRVSSAMLSPSGLATGLQGVPLRMPSGTGVPMHVRGDFNSAFMALGDDGGYGGGWVPLAALKKVLRSILKYLGVLWLFAQLPDLLKEILGSILKDNEGALLNLDQEQAALRFFVRGYVFAVSVHRIQLLLQVLSVKRFHHQQQQQTQTNTQEELAPSEITEICEYFSRRVASEPYDASRVASFITLLTLPISVLREFLKLFAWKKSLSQPHGGESAPAQRARIELCLEHHSDFGSDENTGSSSVGRSNIHHDRAQSSVDFALTFVLDPAHIPHLNAAGGAAWLPYCVSVRLKYSFGENVHISLLSVEGSHGGRACWLRLEDWDKCKQRVARAVDYASGGSAGDANLGRLRLAAESVQRALQVSLQQLRDGSLSSSSVAS